MSDINSFSNYIANDYNYSYIAFKGGIIMSALLVLQRKRGEKRRLVNKKQKIFSCSFCPLLDIAFGLCYD